MKKTITYLLLAGVIFISNTMPLMAFEDPFTDTPTINGDAILYLANKGIIQGYPDGTIRIFPYINRAEVTKILVEGNDVTPDPLIYNNCFDDVVDDWYAPYVCYAKEQGWVQGYADGNFKPAQTILRSEVLKLILVSQKYEIPKEAGFIPYEDVVTTEWYAPYVRVGYEHNLIPEIGPKFNPANEMTRGEAFEILFRTLVIDELQLSVYDKAATNEIFGRNQVQDVRLHGNGKNISVIWETFGGYTFEDYGILMKKGSDFTEADIAVGIDPIYVDKTQTSYIFENLDDGKYYFKVGAGIQGESLGFLSETKSITLASDNCETELSNIEPSQSSEFNFGDEISFKWNGPGCSDYEFRQYMICFNNADALYDNEFLCLGAFTDHFELTQEYWDMIEENFTIEQGSNDLNLYWNIQSRFETTPLTQGYETEPWLIFINK